MKAGILLFILFPYHFTLRLIFPCQNRADALTQWCCVCECCLGVCILEEAEYREMTGSMCNAATAGSRLTMNGICPLINTPDHNLLPKLPVISGLKKYFLGTKLYDNYDIRVVELQMLIGSF